MCAQKGVFLLNSINNGYKKTIGNDFDLADKKTKSFDEIIKEQVNGYNEGPILYKILIPTPQDYELNKYIFTEDYDASLIFPGYEGAAKTIKDELYWKKLKRKNEQESK